MRFTLAHLALLLRIYGGLEKYAVASNIYYRDLFNFGLIEVCRFTNVTDLSDKGYSLIHDIQKFIEQKLWI